MIGSPSRAEMTHRACARPRASYCKDKAPPGAPTVATLDFARRCAEAEVSMLCIMQLWVGMSNRRVDT